jgi:hypothetical protein
MNTCIPCDLTPMPPSLLDALKSTTYPSSAGFCVDALTINTLTTTQNLIALRGILWVSSQDGASGESMEMKTPITSDSESPGSSNGIGMSCCSDALCCIDSSSVGVSGLYTILPPTRLNYLDSRCTTLIRGITLP